MTAMRVSTIEAATQVTGSSGSQVAVGHPRMDFIGWTAGIGQLRSFGAGEN
jgi:hypothetical protein